MYITSYQHVYRKFIVNFYMLRLTKEPSSGIIVVVVVVVVVIIIIINCNWAYARWKYYKKKREVHLKLGHT
jgi:membrane protein YdbS with pleckstrin-like domain